MSEQNARIDQTDSVALGPGAAPVGVMGIILINLYFVVATLLSYTLVALWPVPTPSRRVPVGEHTVATAATTLACG